MKLAFVSLPASDYAASKAFFENILALPVIRTFDGQPHRFTDYDLDTARLKLFEWLEPWHAGKYTSFMIETDDLDGVLDRARDAGFKTRAPEITAWQGRIASVTDPFGNIINLLDASQKGNEAQS